MKTDSKTLLASEVVRQHLGYPSRTLARFLIQKHPDVFKDAEYARSFVRRVRGAFGQERCSPKNRVPRDHGNQSDGFYPLPEPIHDSTTEWAVIRVPFQTCFLLSDVHVPFHDKESVRIAFQHAAAKKPDVVLLNGDIADFYSVSSFDKDPRRRFRLADEIEWVKSFLEHVRDHFPKARIIYKEGNHEERLARNVWRDCPELASVMLPDGSPCTDLATLLGLADFGIEHIGNKQPILLGEKIYALHGHEFRESLTNPVNPARGLYNKTKTNAICGHMHQTNNHTEPGIEHVVSCWSVGGLCNMRPFHMPINKWNTGFAIVEYSNGAWAVSNHKIIKGKVV